MKRTKTRNRMHLIGGVTGILLTLFIAIYLMPTTAQAATGGICGAAGNESGVTWTLEDDGTFILSGSGAMADYADLTDVPWDGEKSNIKRVRIDGGVTSIGNRAFGKCTELTEVDFSGAVNLKSVGQSAFMGCSKLPEVEFSGAVNLESIGKSAFSKCSNLTAVDLSGAVNLKSIGEAAFFDCSNLTAVNLSGLTHLETIESNAFVKCNKLETVDLSGATGLKTISHGAFKLCSELRKITIPGGVTEIGGSTFENCSKLTEVDLSGAANLKTIGSYAFNNCSGLTEIAFPAGVTKIGNGVFNNCSNLETLDLSKATGLTEIGNVVLNGCNNLKVILLPPGNDYVKNEMNAQLPTGVSAKAYIVDVKPITKTYDGQPVLDADIQGTVTDSDGNAITGIWKFAGGQSPVNVADSGLKAVVFIPTDTSIPQMNTELMLTISGTAAAVATAGSSTEIERPNPFVIFLQKTIQQIASAKEGATITIDFGDFNVLTLPVMKQMAMRRDLTIKMEYSYQGIWYNVTYPAGMPINYSEDIPYYGPLKMADMANRDGGVCKITD